MAFTPIRSTITASVHPVSPQRLTTLNVHTRNRVFVAQASRLHCRDKVVGRALLACLPPECRRDACATTLVKFLPAERLPITNGQLCHGLRGRVYQEVTRPIAPNEGEAAFFLDTCFAEQRVVLGESDGLVLIFGWVLGLIDCEPPLQRHGGGVGPRRDGPQARS